MSALGYCAFLLLAASGANVAWRQSITRLKYSTPRLFAYSKSASGGIGVPWLDPCARGAVRRSVTGSRAGRASVNFIGLLQKESWDPSPHPGEPRLQRLGNHAANVDLVRRFIFLFRRDGNLRRHNCRTTDRDGSATMDTLSKPPAGKETTLAGEDSFRRVVEWAPNAMVMVDSQGRIVLVNAETERVFGYRRSELVGRAVETLVPDRSSGNHVAFRTGFLKNPAPRPMGSGRDLFARRADGSEFPVEIGLNPIDTDAGPMVLAAIVDITERVRAQERIEKALNEKTVLLNELHHRVKNNLQMISSLLSLQAGNSDDPRLRDVLSECQNRVRAMGLTHQLLYEHKDFSRVDLGEYLGRLVQLLLSTYRARSRHVALQLVLPPERHYISLGKAIPCGLAVNELVTNAFKHAFPDERHGEITIALETPAEGEISLVVADDGVGLPPGFEPGAVKSLGLRLVPLLAEQLHGGLAVAGGPGSRFSLRFAADDESKGAEP